MIKWLFYRWLDKYLYLSIYPSLYVCIYREILDTSFTSY